MRSIECVQASINEVYNTWLNDKYPEGTTDGDSLKENYMGFAALKIAPKFFTNTMQDVRLYSLALESNSGMSLCTSQAAVIV